MSKNPVLGIAPRILFTLTTASASAFIAACLIANSRPYTFWDTVAAATIRLAGHSGQNWFLWYFALLFVPILGIVELVAHTQSGPRILASIVGIASVLVVPASYWMWQRPSYLGDLVLLLPVASISILVMMHMLGAQILRRWIGVMALCAYFGMFAWLFKQKMYLLIFTVIPLFGVFSVCFWAREFPARFHATSETRDA
jgi:hypothetical protein